MRLPQKLCPPRTSECSLFGIRVVADIIKVRIDLSCIKVDSKSNDKCLLKRQKRRRHRHIQRRRTRKDKSRD